MILLTIFDKQFDTVFGNIEISKQGHTFLTFVVAFLLVSRVTTGLSRYNAARTHLGTLYRESREIIQCACVLTNDSQSEKAKEWRHEVAYRTIILLRCTMAILDYPVEKVLAWNVPELNGIEKTDIFKFLYATNPELKKFQHEPNTDFEESFRVPVRLEYLLKQSILSNRTRLDTPLHMAFENRLLGSTNSYLNGFFGLRKFLTTPVPFPLIQMARTFLFLYVFTVPFVLLKDSSNLLAHCSMAFVLTYGFVGLELIAIELDDPFGDDANDFDNAALAMTSYEDTYLTILDVDGPAWADKLRGRMHDPANLELRPEQSWLLNLKPMM